MVPPTRGNGNGTVAFEEQPSLSEWAFSIGFVILSTLAFIALLALV
jgi:Ni/Fe-hydrogenase subunit HybB-like protein